MGSNKSERGSITVFLALIFVMLFSLIMTSLEAAKSAAAGSFARMLLVCAAESEAAEFYRPLFEEYHLFGIDTGSGSPAGDVSLIASAIENMMPPNIWKIENEDCILTSYGMMADGSGDIFAEQAVKYELLKKAGDLLSGLAEKLGLISKQEKTAVVLKKKLEAEEKIARIDELTLDLMRIIDGIKCDITGSSDTHYTIETGFIKRFLNVQASMNSAGINNKEIYAALSGKYINPVARLEELGILTRRYAEALAEEEQCRAAIEQFKNERSIKETELSLARDALMAVNAVMEARIAALKLSEIGSGNESNRDKNGKEGKNSDDRTQKEAELNKKIEEIKLEYHDEIMFCEGEITRLELALAEVRSRISEEETKLEKYIAATTERYAAVTEKAAVLKDLFGETAIYVQDALMCIMKIKTAQAEAEPKIDEYGQTLDESRDDLSPEAVSDYEDAYGLMEEYVGRASREKGFDYELAEISLRTDKRILEESGYETLLSFSAMNSGAAYERVEALAGLKEKAAEFTYEGFIFDYSSFTTKSESAAENIGGEILSGLSDSFLKMIINEVDNLSKSELSSTLLPSRTCSETENPADEGAGEQALITDEANGATAMAGSIGLSDIGEITDISEDMDQAAEENNIDEYADMNSIMRSAGLVLYLGDSFGCYTEKELTDDTVMKYEQEYIIAGRLSDKDNLSSVILRILLLRLVSSGIYVFSDSELNKKAELIATAAVGFTGMPFLIALAKYLVLFACALEQAMIETAALALGKKTAVITGNEGFMADIADITAFSSALIHQKAEAYPEINTGIGYTDYLCILMLLGGQKKNAYRAMDLIQENLRYEYNEDFLMINCLTQFSVKASFSVRPQFINFGGYRISSDYSIRY